MLRVDTASHLHPSLYYLTTPTPLAPSPSPFPTQCLIGNDRPSCNDNSHRKLHRQPPWTIQSPSTTPVSTPSHMSCVADRHHSSIHASSTPLNWTNNTIVQPGMIPTASMEATPALFPNLPWLGANPPLDCPSFLGDFPIIPFLNETSLACTHYQSASILDPELLLLDIPIKNKNIQSSLSACTQQQTAMSAYGLDLPRPSVGYPCSDIYTPPTTPVRCAQSRAPPTPCTPQSTSMDWQNAAMHNASLLNLPMTSYTTSASTSTSITPASLCLEQSSFMPYPPIPACAPSPPNSPDALFSGSYFSAESHTKDYRNMSFPTTEGSIAHMPYTASTPSSASLAQVKDQYKGQVLDYSQNVPLQLNTTHMHVTEPFPASSPQHLCVAGRNSTTAVHQCDCQLLLGNHPNFECQSAPAPSLFDALLYLQISSTTPAIPSTCTGLNDLYGGLDGVAMSKETSIGVYTDLNHRRIGDGYGNASSLHTPMLASSSKLRRRLFEGPSISAQSNDTINSNDTPIKSGGDVGSDLNDPNFDLLLLDLFGMDKWPSSPCDAAASNTSKMIKPQPPTAYADHSGVEKSVDIKATGIDVLTKTKESVSTTPSLDTAYIICDDEYTHTKRPRSTYEGGSVARPPNAFILYRRDNRVQLRQQFPDISFGDMSKKIGKSWKALDKNTAAIYHRLAEDHRIAHQLKYPGFKFVRRLGTAIRRRAKKQAVGDKETPDHTTDMT
ncbi:hypothetical protein BASA50_011014 [Batrachochytrium salamandrivorans]|uniref:HMG box domain-containing protein n=1 Tax=Batrachochytrium salamandrivorans TaxID=1357716 RepID=A0ABQ8EXC0_9FUNG|nr:hypothetical protein BASA50_011014 [Batrachochytrium salamandrivorans]KAH9253442.1 hypothetical protein BASA81_008639 [Batrachochytrium salamandrivorans]